MADRPVLYVFSHAGTALRRRIFLFSGDILSFAASGEAVWKNIISNEKAAMGG